MADSFRCRICDREVTSGGEQGRFRPFCSDRCRTIDLGSWLEGRYRISATADEEDDPTPDLTKTEHGDA
jgi:endogenous inhibitor of DNA gyrase (YacG/DUF329 family)